MTLRLPQLIEGIDIYLTPLSASGRDAERKAVDSLMLEILGSDTGHYPDGAPFAIGHEDIAVSVSHGAGMALLAVCRTPATTMIGIDIENPRRIRQLERVSCRFVSPHDDTSLDLCRLWTAKEAVYKAMRRPGLSLTDIYVNANGAASIAGDGHLFRICWTVAGDGIIALASCRNI